MHKKYLYAVFEKIFYPKKSKNGYLKKNIYFSDHMLHILMVLCYHICFVHYFRLFSSKFRIKMVNVFGKHLSIDKLRTLILPKVRYSLYIRVGLNSLGWVS